MIVVETQGLLGVGKSDFGFDAETSNMVSSDVTGAHFYRLVLPSSV